MILTREFTRPFRHSLRPCYICADEKHAELLRDVCDCSSDKRIPHFSNKTMTLKPRGRRQLSDGKRKIEHYTHAGTRANNPHVGLVTSETDRDAGNKTYA